MNLVLLLFVVMFFLHIVDDYYLQGWLAQGKSKKWWKDNCPNEFYNKDYIVCLLEHGFSNSFLVHLPLLLIVKSNYIFLSILIYAIIHAIIDDLKANRGKINLITDQFLHVFCIVIILIIWTIYLI